MKKLKCLFKEKLSQILSLFFPPFLKKHSTTEVSPECKVCQLTVKQGLKFSYFNFKSTFYLTYKYSESFSKCWGFYFGIPLKTSSEESLASGWLLSG